MVQTVLCGTGPHLSHTCPTRHLKVQSYEDTCAVACTAKKGNEFERQPSLSGLLQDTVIAHFVRPLKVAELILLKTSHSPLTIATKTLGLSIIGEKYTVASWKRLVTLSCPPSLPPCRVVRCPKTRGPFCTCDFLNRYINRKLL